MVRLSVIVPGYSEQANIEETVPRAVAALRRFCEEFEIIIVDDCGADETGLIADRFAIEIPEVRVLHNPRNLGQGESLIRGFREAKLDWVTHNAMDYPFDYEDLPKIAPLLSEADVIVASRSHRSGYTAYRKLLSAVNRGLLNLLFGVGLHDYNFVQFYRREVLEAMPDFSGSTAFLTPGIIIRAHDMGYRVQEIAVEYHARIRGIATAGSISVILTSVWDMFTFWLRRLARRT